MLELPQHIDDAQQWITQRLSAHPARPRGDLLSAFGNKPAAVLVPIVWHPGQPTLLFTKRHEGLSQHAGQISFPGGRLEADESAVEGALRETEEETGLTATHVRIAGSLATYTTLSRYQVTPVIGVVTPGFSLALQPSEVAEVFEVPLRFLLDRTNYRSFSLPLGSRRVLTSEVRFGPWRIWGATAGMLHMLVDVLATPSLR